MQKAFGKILTQLGVLSANPIAFTIVLAYSAAWIVLQPHSFDWHAVATLATWLMTLFIQRAEHRDTQAIHAKLDEILHSQPGARDDIARIDRHEPEEIERARDGNDRPEPDRA
ncbi:hypothetical protein FPZ24_04965 [Sphingomonas panacisoli]|uniref:Low affinity iron permease family protein n=1 Tax=Sphingomonas panacisoli TaxID=1813879 RepID=A0A5B8LFS2_9SPHN|nr:low affinity iron permease family protein [Sphingomonas panacisoli]QDZ06911.1 hypothetical protein FPZ24_04965 [Sphingomonas panacisoli]